MGKSKQRQRLYKPRSKVAHPSSEGLDDNDDDDVIVDEDPTAVVGDDENDTTVFRKKYVSKRTRRDKIKFYQKSKSPISEHTLRRALDQRFEILKRAGYLDLLPHEKQRFNNKGEQSITASEKEKSRMRKFCITAEGLKAIYNAYVYYLDEILRGAATFCVNQGARNGQRKMTTQACHLELAHACTKRFMGPKWNIRFEKETQ